MANFEIDPEFFLPPGHNIIDGGPDRLPRTYTTPAVPITRRHERFVIPDIHPAPPADHLVQVSWSAPIYILGAAPVEVLPNDEDPMPLNGNPHPLPRHLVNDNLQFALPPYPALGWNAVPLAPEDPVVPAAAADDDGGWGQLPAAADGGGWEPEAALEAPAVDPVQDQESMVIDQPSPSSSDSVHELVNLDPQPQGDIEAEPAEQAPPGPNLEVIVSNPVALDADIAPVVQGPAAEPEEDVLGVEEAQDDNPLAIVPYKPPHIQSDNLFYPGPVLLML
ncbi:hypothetical protein ZWY2020_024510 [Hordeum vulgare]|nr:hypothetical protein ZWY2020_024510 [Hordeum vulgare]